MYPPATLCEAMRAGVKLKLCFDSKSARENPSISQTASKYGD